MRKSKTIGFLSIFIALYAFIFTLGQWAAGHTMPVPGGEPVANDPYEKAADLIMKLYSPAILCGGMLVGEHVAVILIACALMAFFPAIIFTFLWRSSRLLNVAG